MRNTSNKRKYNNINHLDNIFINNITNKFVKCQYCGRTLVFSQLYTHLRKFHDYENNIIMDFLQD